MREVIQQYMNGSNFRVKSVFPLSSKPLSNHFPLIEIYFTPTQIEGLDRIPHEMFQQQIVKNFLLQQNVLSRSN